MGKLTISMAIVNSFLYVYQRVHPSISIFQSPFLLETASTLDAPWPASPSAGVPWLKDGMPGVYYATTQFPGSMGIKWV
jgi:hypothetical protein